MKLAKIHKTITHTKNQSQSSFHHNMNMFPTLNAMLENYLLNIVILDSKRGTRLKKLLTQNLKGRIWVPMLMPGGRGVRRAQELTADASEHRCAPCPLCLHLASWKREIKEGTEVISSQHGELVAKVSVCHTAPLDVTHKEAFSQDRETAPHSSPQTIALPLPPPSASLPVCLLLSSTSPEEFCRDRTSFSCLRLSFCFKCCLGFKHK